MELLSSQASTLERVSQESGARFPTLREQVFYRFTRKETAVRSNRSNNKHKCRLPHLRKIRFPVQDEVSVHAQNRNTHRDHYNPEPQLLGTRRAEDHGRNQNEKRGDQQVTQLDFEDSCGGAEQDREEIERKIAHRQLLKINTYKIRGQIFS